MQPPPRDGPRRCKKQGPGKAPPATPPFTRILPVSGEDPRVMPAELREIATLFNAGAYRSCVEPLEALYFADRNTFHQGLLQYVVALHQLGLGLIRSPRRLLQQALGLLEPYPEWMHGIDLAQMRAHLGSQLRVLPVDRVEADAGEVVSWRIPPPAW